MERVLLFWEHQSRSTGEFFCRFLCWNRSSPSSSRQMSSPSRCTHVASSTSAKVPFRVTAQYFLPHCPLPPPLCECNPRAQRVWANSSPLNSWPEREVLYSRVSIYRIQATGKNTEGRILHFPGMTIVFPTHFQVNRIETGNTDQGLASHVPWATASPTFILKIKFYWSIILKLTSCYNIRVKYFQRRHSDPQSQNYLLSAFCRKSTQIPATGEIRNKQKEPRVGHPATGRSAQDKAGKDRRRGHQHTSTCVESKKNTFVPMLGLTK